MASQSGWQQSGSQYVKSSQYGVPSSMVSSYSAPGSSSAMERLSSPQYDIVSSPLDWFKSIGSSISSAASEEASKVASVFTGAPPSQAAAKTVVDAVTQTGSKTQVQVVTQKQAEAVVKATNPSLPPAQRRQAAAMLVQQAKQGHAVYAPKRSKSSATGWWVLGIGAVVAVGAIALFASVARDE